VPGVQALRFVVNGLLAAVIHFLVLTVCIEVVGIRSAGVANLLAAVAGISSAFLGSRYFVFPDSFEPISRQLGRFSALYTVMAIFHGSFLYVWTDMGDLDYRVGFLTAAGIQALCTYLGGKHWVFKARS
jgi:putative flippase GtrA